MQYRNVYPLIGNLIATTIKKTLICNNNLIKYYLIYSKIKIALLKVKYVK